MDSSKSNHPDEHITTGIAKLSVDDHSTLNTEVPPLEMNNTRCSAPHLEASPLSALSFGNMGSDVYPSADPSSYLTHNISVPPLEMNNTRRCAPSFEPSQLMDNNFGIKPPTSDPSFLPFDASLHLNKNIVVPPLEMNNTRSCALSFEHPQLMDNNFGIKPPKADPNFPPFDASLSLNKNIVVPPLEMNNTRRCADPLESSSNAFSSSLLDNNLAMKPPTYRSADPGAGVYPPGFPNFSGFPGFPGFPPQTPDISMYSNFDMSNIQKETTRSACVAPSMSTNNMYHMSAGYPPMSNFPYNFPNMCNSFSSLYPSIPSNSDVTRKAAPDVSTFSSTSFNPSLWQSLSSHPTSAIDSQHLNLKYNQSSDLSNINAQNLDPKYHLKDEKMKLPPYPVLYPNPFEPDNRLDMDHSDMSQSNFSTTFPEPSPIPGGWIEPTCHFFSNSSSAILYQSLAVSLQRHKVDIDIQPLKYKIYCRQYSEDNSCVTFCVRIFCNNDGTGATYVPLEDFVIAEIAALTSSSSSSSPTVKSETGSSSSVKTEAGTSSSSSTTAAAAEVLKSVKYVVEFQRRTGDGVQFSNLWHSVVEDLKTQVDVRLPPHYLSSSKFQDNIMFIKSDNNNNSNVSTASLTSTTKQHHSVDTDSFLHEAKQTLKCLHKMLTCGFADIRLQAVIAITQMAVADDNMATMIVEDGCLTQLLQIFLGKDGLDQCDGMNDAVLSALSTLAVKKPEVVCPLMNDPKYISKVLDACFTPDDNILLVCAKLVASLSKQLGASVTQTCRESLLNMCQSDLSEHVKQEIHSLLQSSSA